MGKQSERTTTSTPPDLSMHARYRTFYEMRHILRSLGGFYNQLLFGDRGYAEGMVWYNTSSIVIIDVVKRQVGIM
jgi:hypothetical protein